MALFGKKTEKADQIKEEKTSEKEVSTTTKETKKPATPQKVTAGRGLASVIKKPRVTEKAVFKTDKNIYTFEVRSDATKYDVRDAVKEIFGVTPIKVNMVNKKTRHFTSRMRGRDMTDRQMKKAYVYLKEGDRIDLV